MFTPVLSTGRWSRSHCMLFCLCVHPFISLSSWCCFHVICGMPLRNFQWCILGQRWTDYICIAVVKIVCMWIFLLVNLMFSLSARCLHVSSYDHMKEICLHVVCRCSFVSMWRNVWMKTCTTNCCRGLSCCSPGCELVCSASVTCCYALPPSTCRYISLQFCIILVGY